MARAVVNWLFFSRCIFHFNGPALPSGRAGRYVRKLHFKRPRADSGAGQSTNKS